MNTTRWRRWGRWLTANGATDQLTILRLGAGLSVLGYLIGIRHEWSRFFATQGDLVTLREVTEVVTATQSPWIPTLRWWTEPLVYIGVPQTIAVGCMWWILLTAGVCLVVGLMPRAMACVAWLGHLMATGSSSFASYGADSFVSIALFYLAVASFTAPMSTGRRKVFAMMQVHLSIAYFYGGLAKMMGRGWWTGESMWRALTRPPFNVIDPVVLSHCQALLMVSGIAICFLELLYPVMMWVPRTRQPWLALVCLMHIGIAIAMKMPQFGFIMIVLNLIAFGISSRLKPARAAGTFSLDGRVAG